MHLTTLRWIAIVIVVCSIIYALVEKDAKSLLSFVVALVLWLVPPPEPPGLPGSTEPPISFPPETPLPTIPAGVPYIPDNVEAPTHWLSSPKTMYAAPQSSNKVYVRLRPSQDAGDNVDLSRTIEKDEPVMVYAESDGYYFVYDEKHGQIGWITQNRLKNRLW